MATTISSPNVTTAHIDTAEWQPARRDGAQRVSDLRCWDAPAGARVIASLVTLPKGADTRYLVRVHTLPVHHADAVFRTDNRNEAKRYAIATATASVTA